MGLFSSKTKYYVASQIYNLAGDLDDRPNYQKSLTMQSALIGDNIAIRIRDGIFKGPGYNLKAFQKWANKSYTVGLPIADITGDDVGDMTPIQGQIPIPSGSPSGTTNIAISAMITDADAEIWAEDYLLRNNPALLNKAWTYEQDDTANQIVITFADSTPDITFTPTNWFPTARYVVVRYVTSTPGTNGPNEAQGSYGPFRSLGSVGLAGYSEVSRTDRPVVPFTLVHKETLRTEFKDNRAPVQTVTETPQSVSHTPQLILYRRTENQGFFRGTKRMQIVQHQKNLITNKVKRTTYTRNTVELSDRFEITIVEQDILEDAFIYTYYKQNRIGNEISENKIFIYRIGTGKPVIDNLQIAKGTQREFLPMLPLRIENKFIDEDEWDDLYPQVNKAYKRAFGDSVSRILTDLKDNEDIDDIDFAFMVFGVILNEPDASGKEYMYEFLNGLRSYQQSTKSSWATYQTRLAAQSNKTVEYNRWEHAARNRLREQINTPQPNIPQYPPPARSSFILDANIPDMPWYKVTISWSYISEILGIGVGKPGAKSGDIWFEQGPVLRGTADPNRDDRPGVFRFLRNSDIFNSNKVIYMYHQTGPLTYRKLEIAGLTHSNYVYKNKSVVTQAWDAIKEKDEETSFFIPLHLPTVKKLSIKNQNQLAYCSRLLLLNCYVKKKVRWYQRGIFKVIFAIVMITISFMTLGVGAMGAVSGLLGTNMAVGTMLGLVGTAAVIAGAVVNMVAAMILTTIIQKGAVDLFGEKWGALIGSIAGFFAFQMGAQFASTGSWQMNFNSMFQPQNLIKISDAVSRGFSGFVQARMQEIMGDYEKIAQEYKDQTKVIEDRMKELFGSNVWFDPTILMDLSGVDDASLRESSNSFLERTLLTGSDIAEMSNAIISEFPRMSISLNNPIL